MRKQKAFPSKKAILLLLIGCIAMTTYGQASGEESTDGTEEPVIYQNGKEESGRQATLDKEERKGEDHHRKMTVLSCVKLVQFAADLIRRGSVE